MENGFNDNVQSWVVQKFGGTSLGKFAVDIVEMIIKATLTDARPARPAVVCSARSSSSKLEGTTNRLLRAAHAAERPTAGHYKAIIDAIRDDHISAAQECIRSEDICQGFIKKTEEECEDLSLFLEAAQKIGEISSRSKDKIISKGERLSGLFMTSLLEDRVCGEMSQIGIKWTKSGRAKGVTAHLVDLCEIIDFKAPNGLDDAFYKSLAEAMAREVQTCGDAVPVVTGYFGTVPGGLLDQVGRGYTDLCAALVAVGLGANELQIWKEVDGIFTADPRRVPTAGLLSAITPAEAAELTFYGSEVIHPFTMEQVIRARIPIRIKNVMNPRGNGTVIFPDTSPDSSPKRYSISDMSPYRLRSASSSSLATGHRPPKRPTAVTIKHNIIVINIHSNKRSLSHGFFAKIFSTLDKWRLSVDLISTSEVHVSMALHSESALLSGGGEDEPLIADHDLGGAIRELREYGTVDILSGMAILSLVGKQMKHMIGIAGRMFSILGENDVNIEMISQGASEINISCVIESKEADRALRILHTNLFTFPD